MISPGAPELFKKLSCMHATAEMTNVNNSPSTLRTRVLSIQSHVVHGFVGNKCSIFILQRLGIDVDPINTVHLSNHKGYPSSAGTVMKSEELDTILSGLRANNLLSYTHILTGYVGSPNVLSSIAEVLHNIFCAQKGLPLLQ